MRENWYCVGFYHFGCREYSTTFCTRHSRDSFQLICNAPYQTPGYRIVFKLNFLNQIQFFSNLVLWKESWISLALFKGLWWLWKKLFTCFSWVNNLNNVIKLRRMLQHVVSLVMHQVVCTNCLCMAGWEATGPKFNIFTRYAWFLQTNIMYVHRLHAIFWNNTTFDVDMSMEKKLIFGWDVNVFGIYIFFLVEYRVRTQHKMIFKIYIS